MDNVSPGVGSPRTADLHRFDSRGTAGDLPSPAILSTLPGAGGRWENLLKEQDEHHVAPAPAPPCQLRSVGQHRAKLSLLLLFSKNVKLCKLDKLYEIFRLVSMINRISLDGLQIIEGPNVKIT